ncbi:GNAT family N-acetyltransferase [Kitasatospora sp. NPDC006697]|uniref:GNAT family N-acetyltransferase n=1 Tax=Kitasatospora sp. NPDC006697 TaxID=3364020 RepID=UPI00367643BB
MDEHRLTGILDLAAYGPAEKRQVVGENEDPAGVAVTGLTWRLKERHVGIRDGERLVAHAGWVEVPVRVGAGELRAAGIGAVAVAPELRRRGLAGAVVTAAMERAGAEGLEFGLLFCWPRLVPLYGGLGWRPVAGEVLVEQPGGPAVMPMRTMWAPLADGAQWPEGAVRLLSLPF